MQDSNTPKSPCNQTTAARHYVTARILTSCLLLLVCACSIQQSAALALGRLANYSDDLAEAVVQNEILPQLVS
jgi:hypothetical protein